MDFIIEFYESLETLDLIIFWGIIIVIILLVIFSFILINKNKKLKKIIVNNDKSENEDTYNEELPIKKTITIQNELTNNNQLLNNKDTIQEKTINNELPGFQTITDNANEINKNSTIELEKKFIAEEHIMELNKESSQQLNHSKVNGINEEKNTNNSTKTNQPLEMPTGPYQRNVLREMSLSQTSPIGLTSPKKKDDKKFELAKDLDESLNFDNNEQFLSNEEINQSNRNEISYINPRKEISESIKEMPKRENSRIEKVENKKEIPLKQFEKRMHGQNYENIERKNDKRIIINKHDELTQPIKPILNNIPKIQEKNNKEEYMERKNLLNENKNIKEELTSINNYSPRKTEIINSIDNRNLNNNNDNEKIKEYQKNEKTKDNIDPRVRELLNSVSKTVETEKVKSSSEKYLEEVSRKLAEAEIPDEIERTDYELEQEENAIISYKELMEKKDSIQTIDEEEAIISIEELMNRSKTKEENNTVKEDNKLYNLTEEEENDDFIKELKQFRNDL